MPVSSRTSPSHFAGHPLQARKRQNIWPRHYEKEVRRKASQRFLPVVFSQRPGKIPRTSVPGHLLRCKFTQIPLLNEWSAVSARRNFPLPAGGLLSRRQIAGRCDGKAAWWVGGSDLRDGKAALWGGISCGFPPLRQGNGEERRGSGKVFGRFFVERQGSLAKVRICAAEVAARGAGPRRKGRKVAKKGNVKECKWHLAGWKFLCIFTL